LTKEHYTDLWYLKLLSSAGQLGIAEAGI